MNKWRWHLLILILPLNVLLAQKDGTATSAANQLFQRALRVYSHNFDSTAIYLQQALVLYEKDQDWENVVKCYAGLSSLSSYQGKYLQRDSLLELNLQLAQAKLDPTSLAYTAALNNYASSSKGKGDYEEAIHYYQRALANNLRQGNKLYIATNYSNLGKIYREKGDYDEALEHFKEAYRYYVDTTGNTWRSATLGRRIGNVLKMKKDWEAARQWFESSENVLRKELTQKGENGIILKPYVELMFDMADLALEQKDWEQVRNKVATARVYAQKVYVEDQGKADDILGNLYLRQKKYELAMQSFVQAKNKVEEEFENFGRHPLIADKILKIAKVLQLEEKWTAAIAQYHEALKMLSYGFAGAVLADAPPLDSIYAKFLGLEALKGKAESYFQLFHQNGAIENLQLADRTYQSALQLIPKIRGEYLNEASKEALSTNVLPLYEGAIRVAIERYKRSGDQQHLAQAFAYAESNKAVLLLESINEISAKKFGGIPDSLRTAEKRLSLDIAYFEKLLNEEKQKNNAGNASTRSGLERKLFELRRQYHGLVDHLEENYPRYYQLKYQESLLTLAEVQQKIPQSSTMLIEYFVGLDSVYIFAIDRHKVSVHQLAKSNALLQNVDLLRKQISETPSGMEAEKDHRQFCQAAYFLYQNLLAPCLTAEIESLIIVPDDVLGQLPFEILLRTMPATSAPDYSTDAMAYLLEDFNLSYSYSSTLLFNASVQKTTKSQQVFAGFAPSFNDSDQTVAERTCSDNELANLRFSQQEVSEIQNLLGGDLFLGGDASLQNFKEQAPQSNIIHLATHACIDEQDHQFNKIYFADDYLSNNDLYELLFQSQLAVLSACNTGTGQLIKGEGVMSLSRGFIHAGCPSVVMSLWPVDDRSTSNIMVQFYQNMKAGQNKNRALRQAKLSFLSQAQKVEQHPFYWAPFVQFGDSEKIDLNTSTWWNQLGIPALLFVLVGFVLFFLRKTRSKQ